MRTRALALVVAIYAVVGAVVVFGSIYVANGIVHSLGVRYATQYAHQESATLVARLERELALARKLVDSPLLKRWALAENDPAIRTAALEELESYRRQFVDHSWFFVPVASRHYFFNNAAGEFTGKELRYTVKQDAPESTWYFDTLRKVDDVELHIDADVELGVTKVWINAVVKQDGKKIAVAGSGLDLTSFMQSTVMSTDPGVQLIFVNREGFIQGHSNQALMKSVATEYNEARRPTVFELFDAADRDTARARLAALVGQNEAVATFDVRVGKQTMLAAATAVPRIDWLVVVLVDPARVVPGHQLVPLFVILAVALLTTIILVSGALDRVILAPLARLNQQTREIAAGQYDEMAVDREDEIGQLTRSFNVMTETVRDHTRTLEQRVAERTEALQDSNRKVMDSIAYASLIQSALLPARAELSRVLPHSFAYWRPRDVVGGDFYALYQDDAGLLLAVADCTGHGVPGALMTMASKALLDRIALGAVGKAPSELLRELHRSLRRLLSREERAGSQNGLDIGLLRLSPDRRRLSYAGAKISLWVQQPDDTFQVLKGDRRSLGYAGDDDDFAYRDWEMSVSGAQRFFVMTDGILDQAGGPKGFGLGHRRLQAALISWKETPVESLEACLDTLLRDYRGDCPQRDDITLLGFQTEEIE